MVSIAQDEIYIFGGILNGVSRDIYKYDISDSLLTKLDIKLLEPRAAGEVVRFGDENLFFIIGGYNESKNALKTVEIFSCGDGYRIWSGPELNYARKNFMSSFNLGKVYVMGGYDENGNVISSIEILEPVTSSIRSNEEIPVEAVLKQNYPNPFNPSTNISFSLNSPGNVDLIIYSINGELIKNVVSENLSSGIHNYSWDGTDNQGRSVSTGIYLYVLSGNDFHVSKKNGFN